MPEKKPEETTAKSIWAKINEKIKKGIPLTKKDIEPIEYYIEKGGDILDIFDEWVKDQKSLMVKHLAKLDEVKARLLAEVL